MGAEGEPRPPGWEGGCALSPGLGGAQPRASVPAPECPPNLALAPRTQAALVSPLGLGDGPACGESYSQPNKAWWCLPG